MFKKKIIFLSFSIILLIFVSKNENFLRLSENLIVRIFDGERASNIQTPIENLQENTSPVFENLNIQQNIPTIIDNNIQENQVAPQVNENIQNIQENIQENIENSPVINEIQEQTPPALTPNPEIMEDIQIPEIVENVVNEMPLINTPATSEIIPKITESLSFRNQKCLRNSLRNSLESINDENKIDIILSYKNISIENNNIIQEIENFLNQTKLPFRKHTLIDAVSIRQIEKRQVRELLNELKSKSILNDETLNDEDDKQKIAKCNVYLEYDHKLTLKLNSSNKYIESGRVHDDLKINGAGIKVAILDTGIDIHHPGFSNQIIDSIDYTGEGVYDLNGHGTHVACIVGCNKGEYLGIAPEAKLINIKTTGKEGEGSMSDTISGLEYALKKEADIANISLGALIENCDGSDALSRAVDEAYNEGLFVITAAGNFGPKKNTISTPGCAQKALTVGAVDESGYIADFSSRGPTTDNRFKPDIFAPGVDITSAWIDEQYVVIDGTSQAAPHAAGVVALLMSANPNLNNDEIKNVLNLTSDSLGKEYDYLGNQGIINAFDAISPYVEEVEYEQEIKEPAKDTAEQVPVKNTPLKEENFSEDSIMQENSTIDINFKFDDKSESVSDLNEAQANLQKCLNNSQQSEQKKECQKIFLDNQIKIKKQELDKENKEKTNKLNQNLLLLGQESGKINDNAKTKLRTILDQINKTILIDKANEIIFEETNNLILKIKNNEIKIQDIESLEKIFIDQIDRNTEEKYQKNYIPFKDVDDNKWFFTFVDEVKKLKIVSGYTDLKGNPTGEFGPSNLTTVAEALKMALESSGYGQSISNGRPQNKKAENHWAMKYYLKAEELKLDIIKNILDDPNRPITREEFVKLQLEVFKITPLTTYSPIFSDIDEKSDFSGFIYRAYQWSNFRR